MRWWLTTMVVGVVVVTSCSGSRSIGPDVATMSSTTVSAPGLPRIAPPTSTTTTVATPPTTMAPTTAAAPTTTSIPAPREFSLLFTGDVLLHNRVTRLAAEHAVDDPDRTHDFRPLFEPIRGLVEDVDWAVCQLEVNLSADGSRLSGFPRFRAPGQVAADLSEIGFDSCSTANNHTLDHGADGVVETLGVLDATGLHATGTARDAAERDARTVVDVNDVRIAHHAYSYGFNGARVPDDAPWTTNIADEDMILDDVARSRRSGADFIVVSLHWGNEYRHGLTGQQADLGPRLLASPDVDLIIGHHAHVVQRIDRIDGEWLVYGLGNFISNQPEVPRRDELIVRIDAVENEDGSFDTSLEAIPLWVDWATLVVHPSGPDTRPPDVSSTLGRHLDASHARVSAVLDDGSAWQSMSLR